MESSNFYNLGWLASSQPGQTTSSTSFDDWPKESQTSTNHASPSSSATLGEVSDIFTELGGPFNAISYGASWPASSSSSTVPLSSYSTLNGATSTSMQLIQRPPQSPTQMAIDPQLANLSAQSQSQTQSLYSQGTTTTSPPPQHTSPPQQPQQQPFSFSSASSIYHPSILQQLLQQQSPQLNLQIQSQQPQQVQQGTLSPSALHPPSVFTTIPTNSFYAPSRAQSPPFLQLQPSNITSASSTPSSSQPTPQPPPLGLSPAEKRAQLYNAIKPMLQASSFTGAGAVSALVKLLDEYGTLEVDSQLRMEVLTKIRDGAGNHYFRAWAENPIALEITREWLKQAYSAQQDSPISEMTMPLLHIIDRLPLTVESLKASKLGKLVVKLVKDHPTPVNRLVTLVHFEDEPESGRFPSAFSSSRCLYYSQIFDERKTSKANISDMASNIERKWRRIVEGASSKAKEEDLKSKKRKLDIPTKSLTSVKKPAVGSATSTKPIAVKKEPLSSSLVVKPATTTKDAKSDSSFFSAPKAKPKLPTFKRAPPPPPGKKDMDMNIAQPSSIDPFQEALQSMRGRRGSPAIGSGSAATPPPGTSNTPPSTAGTPTPGLTKLGKKKKSVTWAPDGSLESIKLIEPAVYDDDTLDGIHLNLRDLHRGEGAALHAHLFEETIDWSEPIPIEIPRDIEYPPRGEGSEEKTVQEQREQTALSALYMSNDQVPDTPAEATNTIPEEDLDKDAMQMTSGPDVDHVFWSSDAAALAAALPPVNNYGAVADILSQLSAMHSVGGVNGVAGAAGMPMIGTGSSGSSGENEMVNLNNVDAMSLPTEQVQLLLQQLNPQAPFNGAGGDQAWPANQFSQFGYGDDIDSAGPPSRWPEGRGRGRGKGRGRGGRGDEGFKHSKRKPCSFFQSGRRANFNCPLI
ncbi:hypothetical protein D9757_000391 [Collybiopsis confluens]|uniref:TFIIS N-terminal domain-containing protein n=1 Tax=Collybiopsis confluens TaxID=2823264 RepID=A0A8H5I224_9AGAR|nr:hypothetical protein D9757_000391 [Collybiopsis confluens]